MGALFFAYLFIAVTLTVVAWIWGPRSALLVCLGMALGGLIVTLGIVGMLT